MACRPSLGSRKALASSALIVEHEGLPNVMAETLTQKRGERLRGCALMDRHRVHAGIDTETHLRYRIFNASSERSQDSRWHEIG